jgi:hypothetical protein
VEQLEQRIRDMEAESDVSLSALQQRSKELEDQLRQASLQNNQVTAQASEQAQAHLLAVEQLEQRIRDMEAESNASVSALQQRSKELEDQLQQAADRMTLETTEVVKTEAAKAEVTNGEVASNTSEVLLRRAEWITARAVGAILPHGLVAAEAYAAAAMAANPQDVDAAQLLTELARIRRAYPEGLPSVIEAVTTFDENAARFFAADLTRAAEIAEDEALRRNRAGLNRSALLAVNLALELRQQTAAEDGPETLKLQEMKASLLARLGNSTKTSNAAPKLAST